MAKEVIPIFGPISFSDLRDVARTENPVTISQPRIKALLASRNIPGSPISLSEGRGRALRFILAYNRFISDRSSNAFTPNFNIRSFFNVGQLEVGQRFEIVTQLVEADWSFNTILVMTATYGTPQTITSAFAYRKQNYHRIIYDGQNTVRGQTFYEGDNTNFNRARVRIASAELLDV